MKTIEIDGESLRIEDVISVAKDFSLVRLSRNAVKKIKNAREVVEEIIEKDSIAYGIKTGFGELCDVSIPKDDMKKLQENLIRSTAAGVGDHFPEEVVRATMLLSANSLSKGFSGVRLEVVSTLIDMLNKEVYPLVPEKGSVGASGDLAPLAHIALVLMGEGEAFHNGKKYDGKKALAQANIKPLELESKEGLALINGTQVMTAIASLTIYDAEHLIKTAEIASSVSLEALKGTDRAFDEKISSVRKHEGQKNCAHNLRSLLKDSEIIASHRDCSKVQDAYTIRCIPQVLGASKDAAEYARKIVEIEINSSTDNPLIFSKTNEVISAGNFHGQPIALTMDFLGIAIAEIGNFSERRTARLVDKRLSGLPAFLTEKSGLNSGFMIAQYTAASLVSENKILAHPASVDSIPTSANQEDHVSMGTIAARKAQEILKNVRYVIAIELLCASQGLEFIKPLKAGIGAQTAYEFIRKKVPRLEEDRVLHYDIEKIASLIEKGDVLRVVEKKIGKMK